MADSHHTSVRLDWGTASRARWSQGNARKALVFVHGFGGDAETWNDFPSLLSQDPAAAEYDLLFYTYDSKRHRADPSASDFVNFLDALATDPARKVMNLSAPVKWRREPFAYESIVIAAHSLGAVVTRLALLRAHRRRKPADWLNRIRMVLFAPAHLGANILSLAAESHLAPFRPYLQWKWPVLSELEEDSALLRGLHRTTVAEIAKLGYAPSFLKPELVIHTYSDTIVEPARFADDDDAEYVEDYRNHQTVCKPHTSATRPFTLLRQLL